MAISRLQVTVILATVILEAFLLANTAAFFPGEAEKVRNVLLIYFVLQALVLSALREGLPAIFSSPSDLISFFGFFAATALIVIAIPASIVSSFEVVQVVLTATGIAGIVIYIFIKAFIEEIIFRGIVGKRLGILVSSALFGIFHFVVLSVGGASIGAVLFGMFFLAFLGVIWFIIYQYSGLAGSVGSHVAWNMHATGLLVILTGPAIGLFTIPAASLLPIR